MGVDLMRELEVDPHSRLDSGTFATVKLGKFRGQQVGGTGVIPYLSHVCART